MLAEEEELLFKAILTHRFGDHVDEITFESPVVLTTARVGAAPSAAAGQHQAAHVLLFAQDASAPASARFLQLCPGLEQPESGTRAVQLQPCVTKRVLLRGRYQTLPLSLFGYSPEAAAAAAAPPRHRRITVAAALQWLRQQQWGSDGRQLLGSSPFDSSSPAPPGASCRQDAPLQLAVEAALAQLTAYWGQVGTSERLMALHPPPAASLAAAAAVADAICAQLVAGTFGREPVPAAEVAVAAEPASTQQPRPQQQAGGPEQPAGSAPGEGDEGMPDAQQGAPPAAAQEQSEQPQQPLLSGEALLEAAADMAMGWCGMLGAGAAGRTASAVRCGAAGLAAAVLLCSCSRGARLMVARWGAVVLDDVLTLPGAPPSFIRHATTACLLMARCCGTLGAASLLGLWKPARGITWRSRRQQAAAAGSGAAEQAAGRVDARSTEEEAAAAAAAMEVDDEAAAAAEADAAAKLQQQLYQEEEEEEEEEMRGSEEQGEEEAEGHRLLQEQWLREREAEQERLLYGESEEEGEGEEGASESDGNEESAEPTAADSEQQSEQPSPATAPAEQQQGAPAAEAAGQAAADEDEFGGDPLTGAGPAQPQDDGAAAVVGEGDAPASALADDDLYGDLGDVPQVDGAADSPPRRGRRGGADPAERWEMGAEDGDESLEGEQRRHRRSRSRDKKKSKKSKRAKERSRSRSLRDRSRSRSRRDRSRSRSRERRSRRDGEAAERERAERERAEQARRRQQQQEEEERERQLRWRQREEEERRRRYLEQQRQLEEEQRRLEAEAGRRRQQQRQQREGEDEAARRKRARSPAAAPSAKGRQPGEPAGKHARTDAGGREGREDGKGRAAAAAGLQRPPPAPAAPLDEAGRWEAHERQQRQRMSSYWDLKQRAFVGCSQHVARHLLHEVQPQRLAVVSRQLLHLLRAHDAAAAFQAAALELVRAHGGGGAAQPAAMPTPKVSVLVAEASDALQQLAELLAKPLPGAGMSRPDGPAAVAWLLDAVAARRLLPLLAALLHVPAQHAVALEAALPASAPAEARQQAALIEAALAQQLGVGAKALLAVLASSAAGRGLLLADADVTEQLLLAADPGCLEAAWEAAPASEGASLLQHLLVAEAATAQLCTAPLDSEAFAAASETAAALLHERGASGRRAIVQALALQAPRAVPRLLLMLRMHCALLRAACGAGSAGGRGDAEAEALRQYEPDFALLLAASPACTPAGQLLLALVSATHSDVLPHVQQHAVAVQVAASAELRQLEAAPPAAAGTVAGLGAACSQLASIRGTVAAAVMAQQPRALPSLLTYLGAELPQLVAPGEGGEGGALQSDERVSTVTWPAVEALFCEPEKLACCEQALRLLASRLWAPGAAGRSAAYAADGQDGLGLLLRAVLAGTELAEASAADDSWQVLAGHAIDLGEAAACRRRALSFLEAAATAINALLQHLRGSACQVKSRSLLVGLLRAHAALCCQEESLACMLGGMGDDGLGAAAAEGMATALAARYHLASCLRCYVEAAQPWQPALLKQLFWGTPAARLEPGQVAAQSPAEMFATACLLGDLLPAEWPAAGRKATQAPPTDRRYRASFATAIEPCGSSFRRLIAAALTSESRLLRAAIVRVLARAAGLGGGMGPFLVEPLLEELRMAADSPAPLLDARRLLEVIVPLVYRPAIKSAMLAAPFTSTLAQLLGVVVGKLSSPDEGGEALHVCTMAMEATMVLANHEICLNPLASVKQQQLDDMPAVAEAAPLARVLLELLPSMGSNALIAHRVLSMLVASDTGRLALRRAVVALHAAASGTEAPAGVPDDVAVAQAAQWVANRYWAAAEQLGARDAAATASDGLQALRAAYVSIVEMMPQICMATNEGSVPQPSTAQQRFVAALQASLQAAVAAGLDAGGDEHRWEGPGAAEALAAAAVHDPATRMFWFNVRARAAAQSQASAAHTMRRFARRECRADPRASVGASLHPPLTLPRTYDELAPTEPADSKLQQAAAGAAQPQSGPAAEVKSEEQSGAAGGGPAPPAAAVKEEPLQASPRQPQAGAAAPAPGAPPALPQSSHSMDLYGDLERPAGGSTQQAAARQLPPPSQPPRPAAALTQQGAASTAQAGGGGGATQQLEQASSGSLQALLSNPAALQALLKDPVQLQRLLEKHPALISMLKSTLGQK